MRVLLFLIGLSASACSQTSSDLVAAESLDITPPSVLQIASYRGPAIPHGGIIETMYYSCDDQCVYLTRVRINNRTETYHHVGDVAGIEPVRLARLIASSTETELAPWEVKIIQYVASRGDELALLCSSAEHCVLSNDDIVFEGLSDRRFELSLRVEPSENEGQVLCLESITDLNARMVFVPWSERDTICVTRDQAPE